MDSQTRGDHRRTGGEAAQCTTHPRRTHNDEVVAGLLEAASGHNCNNNNHTQTKTKKSSPTTTPAFKGMPTGCIKQDKLQ